MSVDGTPACCRKGEKSEPEPRSPTCACGGTLVSLRASSVEAEEPERGASFFQTSSTEPPCGLGTSAAMSRTYCLSEGTAEASKSGPETPTSVLKYATACSSCFA